LNGWFIRSGSSFSRNHDYAVKQAAAQPLSDAARQAGKPIFELQQQSIGPARALGFARFNRLPAGKAVAC
jgi:hypothetical protein